MKLTSYDIFEHFSGHTKIKNGLSRKDCDQILEWVKKNNYLQILYDYQINVLLALLELLEDKDMFEECSLLLKTVKDHNKVSGKNLKTHL